MTQLELVQYVAARLERLNLRWVVVGAHAASYWGEPRSTHDVDLLVEVPTKKVSEFVASFETPRYYVSESAIREGRMANVIDTMTSDKCDLFLCNDDVDRGRLDRRQMRLWLGTEVPMLSMIDTVIAKVDWFGQSAGSQRQLSDVVLMMRKHPEVTPAMILDAMHEPRLKQIWQQHFQPALDALGKDE